MGTRVTIEGLSDLQSALAELPKATEKNVLLRALKKEAQPIADAGEALAPKRTGKLARSYVVTTKLTRRQKKFAKSGRSYVEVYVGPTAHPKSIQTEFGNFRQAAEPHMRPAWDSQHGNVLLGIEDSIAAEIEKARARIARKAERLARKMGAA